MGFKLVISVMVKMDFKLKMTLMNVLLCFMAGLYPAFSQEKIDLSELKRLDPHGSSELDLKSIDINQNPACKTCHMIQGKNIPLKTAIPQLCVSCHGKAPHSGVLEHTNGKKLTCASCHRSHRAYTESETGWVKQMAQAENIHRIDTIPGVPEYLKVRKDPHKLPEKLIDKKNNNAMILRNCQDCHKW